MLKQAWPSDTTYTTYLNTTNPTGIGSYGVAPEFKHLVTDENSYQKALEYSARYSGGRRPDIAEWLETQATDLPSYQKALALTRRYKNQTLPTTTWNAITGAGEGALDAARAQGKSIWRQFNSTAGGLTDLGNIAARISIRGNPLFWASDRYAGTNLRGGAERLADIVTDQIKSKVNDWNNTVQNSDLYNTDKLSKTEENIASLSTIPLMLAGDAATFGYGGAPVTKGTAAITAAAGALAAEDALPNKHKEKQTTTSAANRATVTDNGSNINYNKVLSTGLAGLAGVLGTNMLLAATPALRKKRILRLWLSMLGGAGLGYAAWKYANN